MCARASAEVRKKEAEGCPNTRNSSGQAHMVLDIEASQALDRLSCW